MCHPRVRSRPINYQLLEREVGGRCQTRVKNAQAEMKGKQGLGRRLRALPHLLWSGLSGATCKELAGPQPEGKRSPSSSNRHGGEASSLRKQVSAILPVLRVRCQVHILGCLFIIALPPRGPGQPDPLLFGRKIVNFSLHPKAISGPGLGEDCACYAGR